MTTMKTTSKLALLATVLGISIATFSTKASAADFGFSVGYSPPARYVGAAVAVEPAGRWIPEHYDSRDEQVLVAPAHCERQYIPAVTETRYDRFRHPYEVVITPARYTEVQIPARYETRCVKVLVPGCYDAAVTTYARPAYGYDRPVVSAHVDFRRDDRRDFRHDNRRDDRHDDRHDDHRH